MSVRVDRNWQPTTQINLQFAGVSNVLEVATLDDVDEAAQSGPCFDVLH
jgi:hypothetical protein